jgi:CBS domain-containing protein
MLISQILQSKRPDLVTVSPEATIRAAIAIMNREGVGALVVTDAEHNVLGVLSERDIVRCLDTQRSDVMSTPVSDVMRTDGPTIAMDDTIQSVMQTMTAARARHVLVVKFGHPIGIVSIGDVVKSRLDETMRENSVLQEIARVHWMAS